VRSEDPVHVWQEEGYLGRVLSRTGAKRTVPGWCVVLSTSTGLPVRGARCDVCGAVARHGRRPSAAIGLVGRPLPDLWVALCGRCHVRVWHRTLWSLATVLLSAVGGLGGAWGMMTAWAWAPWGAVVGASTVGAVLALVAGLVLPGRSGVGGDGWRGIPVRVVGLGASGWTVEIASRSVAETLEKLGIKAMARPVTEHDLKPSLLGGLGAVALVGTVLWWSWHPVVRVVNVTDQPVEVVVDGRTVAVVPGVPGEAAGAGQDVRIPKGWRVLRAVRLDGAVVDETRGFVGSGRAQLFVPGSEGRCFRVEHRAYGRARQPRPDVTELPRDQRFHTLHVEVDAWFEPNPASDKNKLFSGGVRRTLRQDRCR
jgi:hypothetical protein